MAISLARIGFWKCVVAAACLKAAHFALSYRYPVLAQHYPESRDLWVRVFFVSEYLLAMLTFVVGVSTISRSVSTKSWTWTQVFSISICLAALFAVYGWLSR